MKSILVVLAGVESDASTLSCALSLARPFDAHLDCLHVRVNVQEFAASVSSYDTSGQRPDEFIDSILDKVKERGAAARQRFDAFCASQRLTLVTTPPGPQCVTASYRDLDGSLVQRVILASRTHDIVVLSRGDAHDGFDVGAIGNVLEGAGRPVLLAPPRIVSQLADTVAVAWKETRETTRAVASALPILAKAKNILILAAPEGDWEQTITSMDCLAEYFRWHGLASTTGCVMLKGQSTYDAVLEAARGAKADLLIMGGYGHSRVREFVLGGFTRSVLTDMDLPVLLAH